MVRSLLIPCLVLAVAATAETASAQDDPFAESGPLDEAGLFNEATDPADAPSPDQAPDLMDQQGWQMAGRGAWQTAEAITALARTSRWETLNRLLERFSSDAFNESQLAEILGRIPSDLVAKLQLSDALSEPAMAGLEKLLAAGRRVTESPERLRQAIGQLDSESIDRRLAATRRLVKGGNHAIAELASAAVADQPPARRQTIVGMLAGLGPEGPRALRQLALFGTAQVRAAALAALTRIAPGMSRVDLLAAAHAVDAGPQEAAIARMGLAQVGAAEMNAANAVQTLLADLQQSRIAAFQVKDRDRRVTSWSVAPSGQQVSFRTTTEFYAVHAAAADAAVRLRRVTGSASPFAIETLPVEIGYRVIIDPDWGDPQQIGSLGSAYRGWDPQTLSDALGAALESEHWPAAIGLLRVIDRLTNESVDELFLYGSVPGPTPLARAATAPVARVRYEAALVATRLAAGRPYAGSSEVRKTLAEMGRLGERPTAIIVETRADVIARLLGILTELGFYGEVAGGAGELARRIEAGGDLRLVLLKSDLADLSAVEMIDRIRRTRHGRLLPIVFYGSRVGADAEAAVPSTRWDAPLVWIEPPKTSAALYGVLEHDRQHRLLPPLSVVDRSRFAQQAAELLTNQFAGG